MRGANGIRGKISGADRAEKLFTDANKSPARNVGAVISLISFANIVCVTFLQNFLVSTMGSGRMAAVPQLIGEVGLGKQSVFLVI
jgi:hypothetical protein